MIGNLRGRLERLESSVAPVKYPPRVIRIVASDEDEKEAYKLALAEGFDPDGNDIAIIRLIVPAPGQPRREFEPYVSQHFDLMPGARPVSTSPNQ